MTEFERKGPESGVDPDLADDGQWPQDELLPDVAEYPEYPDAEARAMLREDGVAFEQSEENTGHWKEVLAIAALLAMLARLETLKEVWAKLKQTKKSGEDYEAFRDKLPGGWINGKDTSSKGGVGQGADNIPPKLLRLLTQQMRAQDAAGAWEAAQKGKAQKPYLRYTAVLDERTRPLHRKWHGTILPVDHVWWRTHYPPNGWNCRCKAVPVGKAEMEANGWRITAKAPDDGYETGKNWFSGQMERTPKGIDPGFAVNPGDKAEENGQSGLLAALCDAVKNRLEGLEEPLARTAIRQLCRSGFGAWFENPAGNFPLCVLDRADAKAIGARGSIAVISAETIKKQKSHHPELTLADYARAQEAVEKGEKYAQDAKNLAFILNEPNGVVVIVKATRIGHELYVTSMRRMSGDEMERKRTIKKLRRGKK